MFLTDLRTGIRHKLAYLQKPEARIALAHDARTLLLRDDGYGRVRTLDLATALELQVFPDDR